MTEKIYRIYCHSDADGGIAAAIFAKFIHGIWSKHGWDVDVQPVNHASKEGDWHLRNIQWPCSILDFTLHPSLLSQRFFVNGMKEFQKEKDSKHMPNCYWIDHHPTGSSFPFLTQDNLKEFMPHVISKWDTSATSTPGLLRTHFNELNLPLKLIQEYEEFIDLAEIIDGALYVTCKAAHDFSSPAVKLQTLFNPGHPLIDKTALFKKLVRQIWKNPSVEDLFDSDPIYSALIVHEQKEFYKQLAAYQKVTKLRGSVAYANFMGSKHRATLGRFIPYFICEKSHYSIHVIPKGKEGASISCGVNPWNKPPTASKHLGNFFAEHFSGGGHAFVAGGKLTANEMPLVEKLIEYLNS